MGLTRAKAAASPPTMRDSAASIAPCSPPLTGPSRKMIPLRRRGCRTVLRDLGLRRAEIDDGRPGLHDRQQSVRPDHHLRGRRLRSEATDSTTAPPAPTSAADFTPVPAGCREPREPSRVRVEADDGVPRLHQIPGHRPAHDAKSEKAKCGVRHDDAPLTSVERDRSTSRCGFPPGEGPDSEQDQIDRRDDGQNTVEDRVPSVFAGNPPEADRNVGQK